MLGKYCTMEEYKVILYKWRSAERLEIPLANVPDICILKALLKEAGYLYL